MAEPWEENYAADGDGPWNDYAPALPPRHRRGSRAGATMAGSLNAANVEGNNVVPKPKGNPVSRLLGDIGAREVMQGAYGLYGAFGGDALNEYVLTPIDRAAGWGNQLGIGDRTYREAAAQQADEWGMRRPQTPTQRVVADIGEGLTGTGLTMGIGSLLGMGNAGVQSAAPTVRNRLAEFLTSNPVTQVAATATGTGAASTAREQDASPLTQLAFGVGGSMLPGATTTTLESALRRGVVGKDPGQYRQAIDDFAAAGATPSVGQASGKRSIQGMENSLRALPTSEGVISDFAQRQSEEIGTGLQKLARNLSSNPSAESAGRAIEAGASTFAKNIAATRKALYWQVDQLIPRGTSVQLPNTWRTVVDLTTPVRGAENTTGALINPNIATMRKNLQQDLARGGGRMPYEALKELRTRIGRELDASILSPDKTTAQYKALYASLSRDMEAAAKAQGPAAEGAARRANTFTRVSADRLEDIQRVIDKNGGPERIYQAAVSGTRDGGTTIHKVMQSLDRQQQRAVTAAVIRRMGLANPGAQDASGEVFSARTFMTNWNNVSKEAKRALFDRHGPGFSEDMDRITRVAQNIDKGSAVYKNPSGSGTLVGSIGYYVSLAQAVSHGVSTGNYWPAGGVAAVGYGGNQLAEALTNPDVVKWLAGTTKYPIKGTVAAQIQTLRSIGEREDDPEVVQFADALEKEAVNQGSYSTQ